MAISVLILFYFVWARTGRGPRVGVTIVGVLSTIGVGVREYAYDALLELAQKPHGIGLVMSYIRLAERKVLAPWLEHLGFSRGSGPHEARRRPGWRHHVIKQSD